MEGIYYLTSLVAVLLVIRWCIRADSQGEGRAREGLFGMRDHLERKARFKADDDQARH